MTFSSFLANMQFFIIDFISASSITVSLSEEEAEEKRKRIHLYLPEKKRVGNPAM
jgi:hypothetical protein